MSRKRKLKIATEFILGRDKISKNYDLVQDYINAFPERIPDETVAEFAEMHRVLPAGTPYPGRWRNDLTPYAVEIMEELSARSPTQVVSWIKCSQIGATAAVENFIAYVIRMVPGPILYCTAKEDLLKKWVNKRLTPLLMSCGLEDRIVAQHLMKNQRRSGNQLFSKEFPGGSLDMVSAQAESNLRMDSIRYLVLDEAGSYPWNVQGFGDPIKIAIARTANWRSRKKIFIPSTAGVEGECRMWSLYLEGDQRRYFVPCPHCGAFQVLKFPSEPESFYEGFASTEIKWETKAGILDSDSVHFGCDSCREPFFEKDKRSMVIKGSWEPTARSTDQYKKSYQTGRLYSLMDDWDRLAKEEIAGAADPLALQAHHNHNCGIPYREATTKVEKAKVYELRGNYKSGTVPSDKVLFVTASVDVQRGSEGDPEKPPRLEMEICGHGMQWRTWSLLYKVFKGGVGDAYDGAWEDLYHFFESGQAEFRRSDGMITAPMNAFVDSGDDDPTVLEFCTRNTGFYAIKGFQSLKETKEGHAISQTLDNSYTKNSDRFRISEKGGVPYVVIATSWYKMRLYRALATSIRRKALGQEGANFCDFPSDYPDRFFDMLTAEEERADHTFWRPSSRPNEALDLRVYNLCAADVYLYLRAQQEKKIARRQGHTLEYCNYIGAQYVLKKLAEQSRRKDSTPK